MRAWRRTFAIHGLYWLVANLAERTPLLVTVDDVLWVDGPSLSWLAYLGPRAAELRVLVVVTVREGDPQARVPAVEAVLSEVTAHRFALSALSPASAEALVRRDLGRTASAGFCAACWELTGGNPLYVRELLAAARNERLTGGEDSVAALRALASSAVGASVLGRLARMGPDAIELARAVAVLGSQHEVAVAAELAGLDAADAELIADELAAAQVLAPVRPLDYFHPLISEAVYAGIALGARRLAHRRAAAILDRTGATDSVAAHLLMTGPAGDNWVVERLSAAARDARERGAPEVAASYLRRALAEPPDELERPELEGATVVILPRFDPAAFFRAVEVYRATRAELVPPMVLGLAASDLIDSHDVSSLRVLTSGAAPLGADLARACAQRIGCRVKQAYGLTEIAGGSHIAPDDGPDRPDSIGPALPGVECRVVDSESGADAGTGAAGELLIRAPGIMRGYLGDPEVTAATVDSAGWLHTGDIVTVDDNGWYFVADRVKELIKYKGLSVAPAELEGLLLTHPAVADAAVVRHPDQAAGEVPKAYLVLRGAVSERELMDWVAERVAPYKRVRLVEFTDSIPKSPSGKILRRLLVARGAGADEAVAVPQP